MNRRIGFGLEYKPVDEPAHVETVIARLGDGHLWKFSRYFDNPQYWSSPGTPVEHPDVQDPQDVLRVQIEPDPGPDVRPQPVTVAFLEWGKGTPVPDEFEMYDLDDDPMELTNLYGDAAYSDKQSALEALLEEQRALKRLKPVSGEVPGQPVF